MTREPVLTAAGLSGFVMAVLAMAISMGWLRLSPEQVEAVQRVVVPLAVFIVPLAAALWARSQVTPTAAPKTPDGEPAVIVPVAQAQQMGLLPEGRGDD